MSMLCARRVGRTGRFGSRGIAVALLTPRELARLQQYLVDVKGGEEDGSVGMWGTVRTFHRWWGSW